MLINCYFPNTLKYAMITLSTQDQTAAVPAHRCMSRPQKHILILTERCPDMKNEYSQNTYEELHFHSNSYINVSHPNSPSRYAPHWHTYGEFILSTSPSESVFTLASETIVLNQNDLLMIWPCELHSVESAQEGSLLIIQFPGEMLSCTSELHMVQDFITRQHLLPGTDPAGLNRQILPLLHRMERISLSNDPFRDTRKQICLMEIFLLLARDFTKLLPAGPDFTQAPHNARVLQKLSRACSYISQHCDKNITLDDAAAYAGFSKYHFSRIFKEYLNTSFTGYLTSQRVQKAISLFSRPDLSITDAVFLSGFGSVASFNRSFRQVMGCTPSEYRDQMLRESLRTEV